MPRERPYERESSEIYRARGTAANSAKSRPPSAPRFSFSTKSLSGVIIWGDWTLTL